MIKADNMDVSMIEYPEASDNSDKRDAPEAASRNAAAGMTILERT